MEPEDMVTEEPTECGGRIYTARREPDTTPPRWAVYRDGDLAPVGYLRAMWAPEDFGGEEDGWALAVDDGQGRQIGIPDKRACGLYPPGVSSYGNALMWIRERDLGRA